MFGRIILDRELQMADTQEQETIDWDNAPYWANWAAKDKDGSVFWYSNMPKRKDREWRPRRGGIALLADDGITIPGSWKDSLRKRPEQNVILSDGKEQGSTDGHRTTKNDAVENLKQAAEQFKNALNAMDVPVSVEIEQIDCVNMGGNSKRIFTILIKHVGQIYP